MSKNRGPWYLISDAKGDKSVSVTITLLAFYATMFAYLMSMFEQIGPLHIRSFDVAACASFFSPTLALYFGRRYTDAKHPVKSKPSVEEASQ